MTATISMFIAVLLYVVTNRNQTHQQECAINGQLHIIGYWETSFLLKLYVITLIYEQ
jgi:hypothetical protein